MLNPMQLYNNTDKDRPVSNIGYAMKTLEIYINVTCRVNLWLLKPYSLYGKYCGFNVRLF